MDSVEDSTAIRLRHDTTLAVFDCMGKKLNRLGNVLERGAMIATESRGQPERQRQNIIILAFRVSAEG